MLTPLQLVLQRSSGSQRSDNGMSDSLSAALLDVLLAALLPMLASQIATTEELVSVSTLPLLEGILPPNPVKIAI